LSLAAYEGHGEVVRFLVQAGADVEVAKVALESRANSSKDAAVATKSRQGIQSLERYGKKETGAAPGGGVAGGQEKEPPRRESPLPRG